MCIVLIHLGKITTFHGTLAYDKMYFLSVTNDQQYHEIQMAFFMNVRPISFAEDILICNSWMKINSQSHVQKYIYYFWKFELFQLLRLLWKLHLKIRINNRWQAGVHLFVKWISPSIAKSFVNKGWQTEGFFTSVDICIDTGSYGATGSLYSSCEWRCEAYWRNSFLTHFFRNYTKLEMLLHIWYFCASV